MDASGRAVYAPKGKLRDINLRIGLVFQNFNLFPHMSVIENITAAPMTVKNMSSEEAKKLARELLAQIGLSEKEKRVSVRAVGRAVPAGCDCTGAGAQTGLAPVRRTDFGARPELTGKLLNVIRKLADENMTLLIVTHEMRFAHDVAKKVIFMDKGTIIAQGTPDEIFHNNSNERLAAFLKNYNQ